MRESCASRDMRVVHVPSDKNISDVLTKIIPGTRKKELIKKVIY